MGTSADFADKTTVVVKSGPISTTIDGEEVIMDTASGTYYGLNEVGSRIWNLLSEPMTVSQLQDDLLSEYDVDQEYCRTETETFLKELLERDLIRVVDETDADTHSSKTE